MSGLNYHKDGRGRQRCTGGVIVVGIDVAKAELVVGVRLTGTGWTAVNDDQGVSGLVTWIQVLGPPLIVLEATGGYELLCVAALAAAGLPVVVVNPRQVRGICASDRATGEDGSHPCRDPLALRGHGTP